MSESLERSAESEPVLWRAAIHNDHSCVIPCVPSITGVQGMWWSPFVRRILALIFMTSATGTCLSISNDLNFTIFSTFLLTSPHQSSPQKGSLVLICNWPFLIRYRRGQNRNQEEKTASHCFDPCRLFPQSLFQCLISPVLSCQSLKDGLKDTYTKHILQK